MCRFRYAKVQMYYLRAINYNFVNASHRLILLEVAISEAILLVILWLFNDYLATLLSWIIPVLCIGILGVSLIVEWVEKSSVPRWYYWLLVVIFLVPLVVFLFFFTLKQGQLEWMKSPF